MDTKFLGGGYIHYDCCVKHGPCRGQERKHRDHLGGCFTQLDKGDDGLAHSGDLSLLVFGVKLRLVGELDREVGKREGSKMTYV